MSEELRPSTDQRFLESTNLEQPEGISLDYENDGTVSLSVTEWTRSVEDIFLYTCARLLENREEASVTGSVSKLAEFAQVFDVRQLDVGVLDDVCFTVKDSPDQAGVMVALSSDEGSRPLAPFVNWYTDLIRAKTEAIECQSQPGHNATVKCDIKYKHGALPNGIGTHKGEVRLQWEGPNWQFSHECIHHPAQTTVSASCEFDHLYDIAMGSDAERTWTVYWKKEGAPDKQDLPLDNGLQWKEGVKCLMSGGNPSADTEWGRDISDRIKRGEDALQSSLKMLQARSRAARKAKKSRR